MYSTLSINSYLFLWIITPSSGQDAYFNFVPKVYMHIDVLPKPGLELHLCWVKRHTILVLQQGRDKSLLTKQQCDTHALPSRWNNKQRSGKERMALPVFASSSQSYFLSIWHADALHRALFRFQWSLFFLLIPQFVMGKAKQTDAGGEKAQNKHEAYESLRLMLAGEKEKQCFDLVKGEIVLWLIFYYTQFHNKMYSRTVGLKMSVITTH